MARPQKYKSDDERIKAHREHKNNYSRKNWECDICSCKLQLGNKSNHLKSEKHGNNLAKGDEKGVFENIDNLI
jgi:hypothetical protein